jgi:hypothetical protein
MTDKKAIRHICKVKRVSPKKLAFVLNRMLRAIRNDTPQARQKGTS